MGCGLIVRFVDDLYRDLDNDRVVSVLNRILEMELTGVVRYTHYSFLVFGYGRIPILLARIGDPTRLPQVFRTLTAA